MAHTLPNLNYDYNALEPHYDEQTLKYIMIFIIKLM